MNNRYVKRARVFATVKWEILGMHAEQGDTLLNKGMRLGLMSSEQRRYPIPGAW